MNPLPFLVRPWVTSLGFALLMFVGGLPFAKPASSALSAALGGAIWFASVSLRNPFARLGKQTSEDPPDA